MNAGRSCGFTERSPSRRTIWTGEGEGGWRGIGRGRGRGRDGDWTGERVGGGMGSGRGRGREGDWTGEGKGSDGDWTEEGGGGGIGIGRGRGREARVERYRKERGMEIERMGKRWGKRREGDWKRGRGRGARVERHRKEKGMGIESKGKGREGDWDREGEWGWSRRRRGWGKLPPVHWHSSSRSGYYLYQWFSLRWYANLLWYAENRLPGWCVNLCLLMDVNKQRKPDN